MVADARARERVVAIELDLDRCSGAEFEGVAEDVDEGLLQAAPIPVSEEPGLAPELHGASRRLRHRRQLADQPLDEHVRDRCAPASASRRRRRAACCRAASPPDFPDAGPLARSEPTRLSSERGLGGAMFRRAQRPLELIDVELERGERCPELVGGDGKEVVARLDRRAQVGLQIAALRDVDARADVARELAVGRVAGRPPIEDPAVGAVLPAKAVLHLEDPPRIEGRAIGLEARFQVLEVDVLGPADAPLLLHRPSGERQPGLVEEGAEPVGPRHPEQHRRDVGHVPEARVGLVQGLADPVLFRDVPDHRRDAHHLSADGANRQVVGLERAIARHRRHGGALLGRDPSGPLEHGAERRTFRLPRRSGTGPRRFRSRGRARPADSDSRSMVAFQ